MLDDGRAQDDRLLEAMNVDLAELLARRVRKDLVELLDASTTQIRKELGAHSLAYTKAEAPDDIAISKMTRMFGNSVGQQMAFVNDSAESDVAPVLPATTREEAFIPRPLPLPCKPLSPTLLECAEIGAPAPDQQELTPVLPQVTEPAIMQAAEGMVSCVDVQDRLASRSKRDKLRRAETLSKGRLVKEQRKKTRMMNAEGAEVIEDDEGGACALVLRAIRRFTNSSKFELWSMALILLNTIFNGVEAEIMSTTSDGAVTNALDVVGVLFNLSFTLELTCRYVTHGFRLLCGPESFWARFDTTIVSLGVLETLILFMGMGNSMNPGIVRAVRILKIARVLRVMRAVNGFRGLRILLASIIHSCWDGMWVLIVLAISLWTTGTIFTVSYLDVAAEVGDTLDPDLKKHYGTLTSSLYTLYASVFGGIDWDTAVNPLRSIRPAWPLITVFILFVSAQYLCLVNVIMGVFCQGAVEIAFKDHDMRMAELADGKQRYLRELEGLWNEIDTDVDGALDLDQWEQALSEERLRLYLEGLGISVSDAWSFFKLLEDPDTGLVQCETFCKGCLKLNGPATSLEIAALEKTLKEDIQDLFTAIGAVAKEVRELVR